MMNKKGINYIFFLLILSGIGISLIFLGATGALAELAGLLGIDFSISSLERRPFYVDSKIVITDVSVYGDELFEQHNELDWEISFLYLGTVTSNVYLNIFQETGKEDDSVSTEISDILPHEILVHNQIHRMVPYGATATFRFSKAIDIDEFCCIGDSDWCDSDRYGTCDSSLLCNTTVCIKTAREEEVVELFHTRGNDNEFRGPYRFETYCILPELADIDIYVKDLSFDSNENNISFKVGINGTEVPLYCPVADYMTLMNDKDGNELSILLENCYGNITTDLRDVGRGWHDDSWQHRIKIEVDISGKNLISDEAAEVTIDFSEMDFQPEDCKREIIIVPAYKDEEQRDAVRKVRNVTYQEIDEEENKCVMAIVEFPIICDEDEDDMREYYVYFGNPRANEIDSDISGYYFSRRFSIFNEHLKTSNNLNVEIGNIELLTKDDFVYGVSDGTLLKYNADGEIVWTYEYDGPGNIASVRVNPDKNIYLLINQGRASGVIELDSYGRISNGDLPNNYDNRHHTFRDMALYGNLIYAVGERGDEFAGMGFLHRIHPNGSIELTDRSYDQSLHHIEIDKNRNYYLSGYNSSAGEWVIFKHDIQLVDDWNISFDDNVSSISLDINEEYLYYSKNNELGRINTSNGAIDEDWIMELDNNTESISVDSSGFIQVLFSENGVRWINKISIEDEHPVVFIEDIDYLIHTITTGPGSILDYEPLEWIYFVESSKYLRRMNPHTFEVAEPSDFMYEAPETIDNLVVGGSGRDGDDIMIYVVWHEQAADGSLRENAVIDSIDVSGNKIDSVNLTGNIILALEISPDGYIFAGGLDHKVEGGLDHKVEGNKGGYLAKLNKNLGIESDTYYTIQAEQGSKGISGIQSISFEDGRVFLGGWGTYKIETKETGVLSGSILAVDKNTLNSIYGVIFRDDYHLDFISNLEVGSGELIGVGVVGVVDAVDDKPQRIQLNIEDLDFHDTEADGRLLVCGTSGSDGYGLHGFGICNRWEYGNDVEFLDTVEYDGTVYISGKTSNEGFIHRAIHNPTSYYFPQVNSIKFLSIDDTGNFLYARPHDAGPLLKINISNMTEYEVYSRDDFPGITEKWREMIYHKGKDIIGVLDSYYFESGYYESNETTSDRITEPILWDRIEWCANFPEGSEINLSYKPDATGWSEYIPLSSNEYITLTGLTTENFSFRFNFNRGYISPTQTPKLKEITLFADQAIIYPEVIVDSFQSRCWQNEEIINCDISEIEGSIITSNNNNNNITAMAFLTEELQPIFMEGGCLMNNIERITTNVYLDIGGMMED